MQLFKPIYHNYCFDYCQNYSLQKYILATSAVVLFDSRLANIIWANSLAANWLAVDPLGQKTKHLKFLPQIKMACQKLHAEYSYNLFLKSPAQFLAKSIAFTIEKTFDNNYLLISQPAHHRQFNTKQMAEKFVNMLAKKNIGSAILNASQNLLAATTNIDATSINSLIAKLENNSGANSIGNPIVKGKIKINNKKIRAHITAIKIGEENFYFLFFPFFQNYQNKLPTINRKIISPQIITNSESAVRKFSTRNNNLPRWYFKTKIEKKPAAKKTLKKIANIANINNTDTDNINNIEGKKLSQLEAKTFAEIGSQLSGEKASDTLDTNTATEFIPSSFVQMPSLATPSNEIDGEVDGSILTKLPIAVLVFRDYELLFANDAFFQTSGYDNLHDLQNAGGISALFTNYLRENIYHKNGSVLANNVKIQTVPWNSQLEKNNTAQLLVLQQI